eukprot:COSAG06_NODE_450_length_15622_cov_25.221671_8_plen_170_part_00
MVASGGTVRARARKRGRKRAPARSAPPSSWCTYPLRQVPADSPCSIVWLSAGRDGIQIAPPPNRPPASAARGHPSAPFCAPPDTLTSSPMHNTLTLAPTIATPHKSRLVCVLSPPCATRDQLRARPGAEDMCIGPASAATITRVLAYSARTFPLDCNVYLEWFSLCDSH